MSRLLTRREAVRIAAVGLTLCLAGTVSACGDDGSETSAAEPEAFSVTQKNAWGTTTITEEPTKVAVVSDGDRDIAYSLGVTPVIEPEYPGAFNGPYTDDARQRLDITEPALFDATDGTDFEAIAAAGPDVILGMNAYSMAEDYKQLSKIAPVVTFADKGDSEDLTWQERLTRAAEGLGREAEATKVVKQNEDTAAAFGEEHPEVVGKTYTYLVVHPDQLSYMSHASAPENPLDDMGLKRAPNAGDFDSDNNAVALENIRDVDADMLLIAYPFGDEGVLSKSELESNKLFNSIPAVREGRWAVINAENGLASALAYPTVLAYPWVIEQLGPLTVKAAAGKGGA